MREDNDHGRGSLRVDGCAAAWRNPSSRKPQLVIEILPHGVLTENPVKLVDVRPHGYGSEVDVESREAPQFAFKADVPVVVVDDTVHQPQPETGALPSRLAQSTVHTGLA